MRVAALTLALTLGVLGACSTTRVSNPILPNSELEDAAQRLTAQALPISVKLDLQDYLAEETPIYFLVADDGGHSLDWSCNESPCDHDGVEELEAAQARCEAQRLGMSCTLLYLRRKPLSRGIEFKSVLNSRLAPRTEITDPQQAEGKIIYLPGFSGWFPSSHNFPPAMDNDEISPALIKLEDFGWDVDVLNIMHLDRTYLQQRPDLIVTLIRKLARDAKQSGYRKLVLYGGSLGAAEIMWGVSQETDVDAIALMEPGWHGPKYGRYGIANTDHKIKQSEILDLLSRLKVARIAFAFFNDSRWYRDFSSAAITKTLAGMSTHAFLLARPNGLSGHGSSWSNRFANLYARCLHLFFRGDINSASACKIPEIDEDETGNWASNERLREDGYEILSGAIIRALLDGKALCSYQPRNQKTALEHCQFWRQESRNRSFANEFNQLIKTTDIIEYRDDGFCRHNGLSNPTYACGQIFRFDEDTLAITSYRRGRINWYKIVEPARIAERQAEIGYHCSNKSKLDSVSCQPLKPSE